MEKAINIRKELRKYGFIISVDDFGVGYFLLRYVQKLPFDEFKIDCSFTNKITEKGTEAVVRAIIQLAQFFEMETVAEGIESEEEASILKTIGCSAAQGFLYYKPMPIEQVELLLDSLRSLLKIII
ncbi:EAL domain-containing protein [Massilibacterium senegalense]|uniref:EAL domain-containing protein n=1 Tax=Massilibacterium senegalense TaxID=1632858 RepID=UPI000783D298|nr:EAL domain-containing protein [Massilibacterium senegalense]